MPFDFEDFPGLGGIQLRLARGYHEVLITGSSLVLLNMTPDAKIYQAGNNTYCDLSYINWLLLPVLRLDSAIPAATRAPD